MKKLLLSLGAIGTIATPIVTMISCGATSEEKPIFMSSTLTAQEVKEKCKDYIGYSSWKDALELNADVPEIRVADIGWVAMDAHASFEDGLLTFRVDMMDFAGARGSYTKVVKVNLSVASISKKMKIEGNDLKKLNKDLDIETREVIFKDYLDEEGKGKVYIGFTKSTEGDKGWNQLKGESTIFMNPETKHTIEYTVGDDITLKADDIKLDITKYSSVIDFIKEKHAERIS